MSGKCGLHIQHDHFKPEIINPDTEEVLPPGEKESLYLLLLPRKVCLLSDTGQETCLHSIMIRGDAQNKCIE
jgi:hypothetical protein